MDRHELQYTSTSPCGCVSKHYIHWEATHEPCGPSYYRNEYDLMDYCDYHGEMFENDLGEIQRLKAEIGRIKQKQNEELKKIQDSMIKNKDEPRRVSKKRSRDGSGEERGGC